VHLVLEIVRERERQSTRKEREDKREIDGVTDRYIRERERARDNKL